MRRRYVPSISREPFVETTFAADSFWAYTSEELGIPVGVQSEVKMTLDIEIPYDEKYEVSGTYIHVSTPFNTIVARMIATMTSKSISRSFPFHHGHVSPDGKAYVVMERGSRTSVVFHSYDMGGTAYDDVTVGDDHVSLPLTSTFGDGLPQAYQGKYLVIGGRVGSSTDVVVNSSKTRIYGLDLETGGNAVLSLRPHVSEQDGTPEMGLIDGITGKFYKGINLMYGLGEGSSAVYIPIGGGWD